MHSRIPVKFFFLPNEGDETSLQVGPRRALQDLQNDGRISELQVCSFLVEAQRAGGYAQACRSILGRIRTAQPDVLLWQHVSEFELDEEFVHQLRVVAPSTLLAYHEGDAFGGWRKRYTKQMKALTGGFDVVFQTSLGPMRDMSARVGAKRIYWVPSAFDKDRFGGPPPASTVRQFDTVMIGSLIRRIPYLWEFPGATERVSLADQLSKILGDRFAVFGSGWKTSSCRGTIPYAEQHGVIQDSWVSVMWDHFCDNSYYFSDRLPIALAAGVAHVTSFHPGYDEIFRDCRGLIAAKTVREAVEATMYLLSLDRRELMDLGERGREFAFRNFEVGIVFGRMFQRCLELLDERSPQTSPTRPFVITNA